MMQIIYNGFNPHNATLWENCTEVYQWSLKPPSKHSLMEHLSEEWHLSLLYIARDFALQFRICGNSLDPSAFGGLINIRPHLTFSLSPVCMHIPNIPAIKLVLKASCNKQFKSTL